MRWLVVALVCFTGWNNHESWSARNVDRTGNVQKGLPDQRGASGSRRHEQKLHQLQVFQYEWLLLVTNVHIGKLYYPGGFNLQLIWSQVMSLALDKPGAKPGTQPGGAMQSERIYKALIRWMEQNDYAPEDVIAFSNHRRNLQDHESEPCPGCFSEGFEQPLITQAVNPTCKLLYCAQCKNRYQISIPWECRIHGHRPRCQVVTLDSMHVISLLFSSGTRRIK